MARAKPATRRMISAHVVRTERLTPHFQRITIGGEGLRDFQAMGGDQAFRLFFRRPQQDRVCIPTLSNNGWMAQYMLMSRASRPYVRFYTVRAFRTEQSELDLELVLHDANSPASDWARQVRPGEEVGLFDEGGTHTPTAGVDWQLLVGDESAVPAILSILDTARQDLPREVFLEVSDEREIRKLNLPDTTRIHWLPRNGQTAIPGQLALATVTAADLPAGRFSTFVAGENGLPTGLRSHLIKERNANKNDVTFIGYWRHGKSSPG